MAQLITVRLNKSDQQPLGFRLQGGKDFGTPLVVQKVNGGSAAERAGLLAGDALVRVNNTDVYSLRHQEAQDAIRAAGGNLELVVQRGGSTWRPSVTPTGSLPRPGSRLGATPTPVTNTSLKATPQPARNFGSGHNNVAKPFGYANGGSDAGKSIVNKQYNTPVNMYSDQSIAETLSAQTEVLAGGVLGVNFKKNEKTYDAEKSAVFKVLQEEENDPEPEVAAQPAAPAVAAGLRHVSAPVTRPDQPINNTGGLPPGQNICEECERLITGVFVRIKDKNLHVECFKCSTCGASLKNQGYYNLNGKLYCDIHAKLVARQNPPAPHLEPVTVPPGGRAPTNSYTTPLPPLSTTNYTNGSSSMFSPSSNFSGPKPFGSSVGSAYSPSLSPRSAPMSPARPVAAPVAPVAPVAAPLAPTMAPAPPVAHAPPPFAPNKSLKSVVWPPPNPLEDDTSLTTRARDQMTDTQLTSSATKQIVGTSVSAIEAVTSEQKVFESCEQSVSSQAIATSTVSSMATSSTMAASESIMESAHTQEVHESTSYAVQAFSEQKSGSQTVTMYQSQTSDPIQKSFDNSEILEKLRNESITTAAVSAESATTRETIQSESFKAPEPVIPISTSGERSKVDNQVYATQDNESKQTQETTKLSQEPCPPTSQSDLVRKQSLPSSNIQTTVPQGFTGSMVDALTTASDRPFSPLPISIPPSTLTNPISDMSFDHLETQATAKEEKETIHQPALIFAQQPQRSLSPMPPIQAYNPPQNMEEPVPMPAETKPYIPPDFKIIIEPKVKREAASSPMVDALTTAPERPYTPVTNPPIERGSLIEALTIAPDRSYSPLPLSASSHSQQVTCSVQSSSVEVQSSQIVKPIATQTTTQMREQVHSEFSSLQNTCQLQSSSAISAFAPVAKQVFPPPQPEEFCKLANFPPISGNLKTSFAKSNLVNQETMVSESKSFQSTSVSSSTLNTQSYSTVKTAQSYFEQLDQNERLSSTAVRSKSGLHKPDDIPTYQRNFDQLPSQRGITPEVSFAPAILQRPITPTTEPPLKKREKSVEPKVVSFPPKTTPAYQQVKQPAPAAPPTYFHKDTPISMTFQPVTDEAILRVSPARSRPSTPSMINKPAPIIPHYQMNLVTLEYNPPETNLFNPTTPETSRSPTPKLRSRSPAQGPPPNPLKAHAPRIKESTPQHNMAHSLLTQATSNLRKEHDMSQKGFQSNVEIFNSSGAKNWAQDQPSVIKEQRHSNVGFKSENYEQGNMKVKEDSMINQNFGQRQMQSQNISERGSTIVQSTRQCFEEFESTQSAKLIEIRKGGQSSSQSYQQSDMNIRPSTINPKQVFPPPIMSVSSSQQSSSVNQTNQTMASKSNEIGHMLPSNSGANQSPVCDPTPSTGSSVGAGNRGKTFGVSSAPKRGRGVLNKAAMPGSRVPLCASCNGNIRGPFITALGRIWCPDHFVCVNATCKRPLQDIGFVEEGGQLYCEYCFEQYIAPACDKCHGKIKGDCLNAIGKHFHPECFSCVYCGKLFGNNPFFLEDGLPYCESDWNELFTTKCFACGFPVEAGDRWVEALNNNYHSQCFNCTVCKKNLEGQSFFAKGGRPFCKMHAR